MKLMLDTQVLVEVCTPGRFKDTKEWFRRLLLAPSPPELLVSVLADFELRRTLHRKGATKSLQHLEDLTKSLRVVPLSADAAHRAVVLASTVHPQLSDADAIVAAQAMTEGATLVTADQVLHSVPGLNARAWGEIDASEFAMAEPA